MCFSQNLTNVKKPYKLKKTYQKLQFCDISSKFDQFGLNTSAKTHQVIDPLVLPVFFYTPGKPGGANI
jgi:hypothetical protein